MTGNLLPRPLPLEVGSAHIIDHSTAGLRDAALRIAATGIAACDPAAATRACVLAEADALVVDGIEVPLRDGDRITVLGAGKASLPIAQGLHERLGDRLAGGTVVVPHADTGDLGPINVVEADHPLPTERSVLAARRLLDAARELGPRDVLICCFTGGSSALASLPPDTVAPEEKRELHRLLLMSGAPVEHVNAVRKHVSAIKGGRLAAATSARIVNLTVSDVARSPIDAVTDPSVHDTTTVAEAVATLREHDLWNEVPAAVRAHLEGPDAASPDLRSREIRTVILADGSTACRAMAAEAQVLGLVPTVVSTTLTGESREVGRLLGSLAAHSVAHETPWRAPTVLLGCGGETTVSLKHPAARFGTGGPNQEAALGAAREIAGQPIAALFIDTDGSDGGTPLAGGLVDGTTVARAAALGVNIGASLRSHRSTAALEALGDGVRTDATATNVNDLFVIVLGRAPSD